MTSRGQRGFAARIALAALAGLATAGTASAVSFTFPSVNITPVGTTEFSQPLNPTGAPAVQYDFYSLSVNWSQIAGTPFSNEARMRLFGGPVYAGGALNTSGIAASNGLGTTASTTLTWQGDMNTPYTGGTPMNIGARQIFTGSTANWNNTQLTVSQWVAPTGGNYAHDDGGAENSIGITGTGTFDMVWLNRFKVQSGGERIEHVQIAFGNPGNTSTGVTNGMPVQVLLYEDTTGGSAVDAVLKSSVFGTVQSVNTNTYVDFDVPDVVINGNLVVGAVMRNLTAGTSFIAGIDQTDPSYNNRSFIGFTTPTTAPPSPLDINNFAGLGANFGSADGFGLNGNFTIRATGTPVPEPTTLAGVAVASAMIGLRRRR